MPAMPHCLTIFYSGSSKGQGAAKDIWGATTFIDTGSASGGKTDIGSKEDQEKGRCGHMWVGGEQ